MERAPPVRREAGAGVGERRPCAERQRSGRRRCAGRQVRASASAAPTPRGNGAGDARAPGGRCGRRRAPPLHREAMERAPPVRREAGAGGGERRPYTEGQWSGRRPCAGRQVRASASAARAPGGNGAGVGGGFGAGEEGSADALAHGVRVHPAGVELAVGVVEDDAVDAEGYVVFDGVIGGVGCDAGEREGEVFPPSFDPGGAPQCCLAAGAIAVIAAASWG